MSVRRRSIENVTVQTLYDFGQIVLNRHICFKIPKADVEILILLDGMPEPFKALFDSEAKITKFKKRVQSTYELKKQRRSRG